MTKSSSLQLDNGGPVNLRGIHYQLLATFREVGGAIRVISHDDSQGHLTNITLVVEPRGGGDSAVLRGTVRRVQQIKSHQGVWSLAQLVNRVFPDLFRAYCNDPGLSAVELITNGRLDRQAHGLAAMLEATSQKRVRGGEEQKQYEAEESEPLPWFKGPARPSNQPTVATYADFINHISKKLPPTITAESPSETLHRDRIKDFLSRLSLRAGLSFEDQETQCRAFLEAWGISPNTVSGVIDQVVGHLLRQGSAGNRAFTFGEIALTLGLAKQDLSNWSFLSSLSRDLVLTDLARPLPGYNETQDVRRSDPLLPQLLQLVSPPQDDQLSGGMDSPSIDQLQPIVVWGDSGIGKTWLLARSAYHLAQPEHTKDSMKPALLWLSSQQDPQSDLQAVAQKFCHRLWGREQPLPAELLADRVKQMAGLTSVPWLVAFIDNVHSQKYLNHLYELPHAELGILLVVAVTTQLGGNSPGMTRLRPLKAPGFNKDEVLRFLEHRSPTARKFPPTDVRKLLETPIFAALYAALKNDGSAWQPEDEYGLIQQFWLERIARPRSQTADALAWLSCSRLRDAAATCEQPPQKHLSWTVAELKNAGVSQEDLDFLEATASLVPDAWSRTYSLSHERIMQWAAAEGALRAFQSGTLQAEDLSDICAAILISESQARWTFGYVPADLLWLLLDPDLPENCGLAAEAVLVRVERHHSFLRLKDWLATLGPRLVPLLFRRLRSADPEDTSILYTYRDALKKIPSAEVAQHASRLLTESSMTLQEFGAQFLGEREHPPALDALWALYQDWWAAAHSERPSNIDRRQNPGLYHVAIGEKALRRSVRNQPDWLERKLLDAESLDGANSALLFLLASTPRGEDLWRRHKELLRSRLSEERQQRGFIRCILSFQDREERLWLESKVNEPRHLVAPSARGALALLAPESVFAQVDPEALLDLATAREWWFPLAWIQKPREAVIFLRDLILSSDDPMRTAFSFGDFELRYSKEIVDFLLDTVKAELNTHRDGRVKPGRDPLWIPLLQLSNCNTLDQLELFWNPAHRQLDSDLADLVCDRGPNDTGWVQRDSKEQACEVLKLMAGPGMAKAGAVILEQAKTWTGGRDGLDLAVRTPDMEARAAIRRRALDTALSAPPMTTEYPMLQRFCVEALAYLRDFEVFAQGVVQWGLELPPDLAAYLDGHREEPDLLKVAKEALEIPPIRPGAFFLLGFHGGPEALDYLRMYRKSLDSADLELGWILGLDYSRDCSSETVTVFAEGLSSADDRIHFSSWRALIHRIENPRAQEILLSTIDNSRKNSMHLAASLLDIEIIKHAAANQIWKKVRKDPSFLFYFANRLEEFAVLGTQEVGDFLLDQATGVRDSMARTARHSAIRGLAVFDRDSAFRAALACREEEGDSEGIDWPALLIEIGGAAALSFLKAELAHGRDMVRLYALGEALRAEQQFHILVEWLQDEDPRVREGTCYAACAQSYDLQLEQSVIRCCLDPEECVRHAAQAAFDHLWKDREVGRLIGRLREEPNPGRRWTLIDSALAVGYPGVRPRFGQNSWFSELVGGLPYYEVKYSIDRLKEHRKKFIEKIKRKSKDFRSDT